MKIRIQDAEAEFRVSGTISRPFLIAVKAKSPRLMRASEFRAVVRPHAVRGAAPGTLAWCVNDLWLEGRVVDGRRTTDTWVSRWFWHPLEIDDDDTPEDVMRVIRELARGCLPPGLPPAVPARTFSIPDRPAQEAS